MPKESYVKPEVNSEDLDPDALGTLLSGVGGGDGGDGGDGHKGGGGGGC